MPALIRIGACLCSVLIVACASTAADTTTAGSSATKSGTCHADRVQWAVGQAATQEVTGRVWRESGSGLIRPIAPNQAVAANQRDDRINVYIDAGNIITRITCG